MFVITRAWPAAGVANRELWAGRFLNLSSTAAPNLCADLIAKTMLFRPRALVPAASRFINMAEGMGLELAQTFEGF